MIASGEFAQLRQRLADAVAAIRADEASANYLARGPGLAASDVTRITFDVETTAAVTADVLTYADQIGAREWMPYDPSYQLAANQALVDETAEIPELVRLDDAMIAAELDTAPSAPVVAMIHRVFVEGELAITAYRLKGQGIATRRPRGIRILVPRDGIFERIDREVLYYEPAFDALEFDGRVFVTAITTLQRALGSSVRAKAMASTTFATATAGLRIEGVDALADAVVSDPTMIAKMAQLARVLEADPGYAALLTTERVLDFLDRNPHVPIATTGVGSDRRLLFEPSPQKRYLIVKALADDYLRSDLSQRSYEVGSKISLEE